MLDKLECLFQRSQPRGIGWRDAEIAYRRLLRQHLPALLSAAREVETLRIERDVAREERDHAKAERFQAMHTAASREVAFLEKVKAERDAACAEAARLRAVLESISAKAKALNAPMHTDLAVALARESKAFWDVAEMASAALQGEGPQP